MELNRLEKPVTQVPYHVGVKRYYLPFNKGGIGFGLLELFQEVRRNLFVLVFWWRSHPRTG